VNSRAAVISGTVNGEVNRAWFDVDKTEQLQYSLPYERGHASAQSGHGRLPCSAGFSPASAGPQVRRRVIRSLSEESGAEGGARIEVGAPPWDRRADCARGKVGGMAQPDVGIA
jgi:hypothetical protein